MLYYNGKKVSANSKLEVEYVLPEIDNTPTEGSKNPISSDGVYQALKNVDVNVNLTVDQQVIEGSPNPVSGGAVASYFSMPITNFKDLFDINANLRGKTLQVNDYDILDLSAFPFNSYDSVGVEYLCVHFTNDYVLTFRVSYEKGVRLYKPDYYHDGNPGSVPATIEFSDTEDWIISGFKCVYAYPSNNFGTMSAEEFITAINVDVTSLGFSKNKLDNYYSKNEEIYLSQLKADNGHTTVTQLEKETISKAIEPMKIMKEDGQTEWFAVPYNVIPGLKIDASALGAKVDIEQVKPQYSEEFSNAISITFRPDIKVTDFIKASEAAISFNGRAINITSVVQHATSGRAVIGFYGGHSVECTFYSDHMELTCLTSPYSMTYGFTYDFSNSEPQRCYFDDMSYFGGNGQVGGFSVYADGDSVGTSVTPEEFYSNYVEIYFEPIE